ncbi:hypothetical protein [Streptomyces sp. ISL-100]|uniref:hypothetical protein n=1 Tax=Streptomyces sp. ISL-100 TaxID=2819173 RepID=UPI001BEB7213|nr:hypothetical protein [Streptomyces sp. ISL-100]MBT2396922.1 hypothetical protein [Streptomyces sp. ISL-100]
MSTKVESIERYAYLWQASSYPHQWVIWNTAAETMVFDTQINCPVDIDGEATLREVLRRMREAGVPESYDYPGRPCAA